MKKKPDGKKKQKKKRKNLQRKKQLGGRGVKRSNATYRVDFPVSVLKIVVV